MSIAAIRKPLSKKIRFDVFKRDAFTCQYCGQKTPAVVLEIDHVHPVSEGGTNHIDNLLTACFDCNRGKGAGLLTSIPDSIEQRTAVLKERQAQVKAYNKLLKDQRRQADDILIRVEDVFCRYFPKAAFTEQFRDSIRINFIQQLAEDQLIVAVTKACLRRPDSASAASKYFCGVCWNMIRGTYGPR